MLVATSSARHSRVYGSTTLSARNFRPLAAASCTKSSAHSWFAPLNAGRADPVRSSRLRVLRRIVNPASRYTRYTRLWFTTSPLCCNTIRNRRYPQRGFSRAASFSRCRNPSSFRRLHQPADPPRAHQVVLPQPARLFLPLYELQPFFSITAFSMSLSRLRSATSFFNRPFSSSNCRNRCASPTLIPPYFAFHA